MELQRRGVSPVLVVTATFLPLVRAQAKARRVDPRVVVIEHPLGGLSPGEMAGRIEAAYAGLARELDEVGQP